MTSVNGDSTQGVPMAQNKVNMTSDNGDSTQGVPMAQNKELPYRLFATKRYPPKGRVNSYSKLQYLVDIVDQLHGSDEYEKLLKSPFGGLFKLKVTWCSFSGAIVHSLLCRQVDSDNKDEMWFTFGGQPLRFSIIEFEKLTGLNCGPSPDSQVHIKAKSFTKPGPYWSTLIGDCESASVEFIADLLKSASDMTPENKLKLSLLLIVDGILTCGTQPVMVSPATVEMVQDLDSFFSYPWGRVSFMLTMRMVKVGEKVESKEVLVKKLKQQSVVVHGFPIAIQLLAFHAIPRLFRDLPGKEDNYTFTDREIDVIPVLKTYHSHNILEIENAKNLQVNHLFGGSGLEASKLRLDAPSDPKVAFLESLLNPVDGKSVFTKNMWPGGDSSLELMEEGHKKGKHCKTTNDEGPTIGSVKNGKGCKNCVQLKKIIHQLEKEKAEQGGNLQEILRKERIIMREELTLLLDARYKDLHASRSNKSNTNRESKVTKTSDSNPRVPLRKKARFTVPMYEDHTGNLFGENLLQLVPVVSIPPDHQVRCNDGSVPQQVDHSQFADPVLSPGGKNLSSEDAIAEPPEIASYQGEDATTATKSNGNTMPVNNKSGDAPVETILCSSASSQDLSSDEQDDAATGKDDDDSDAKDDVACDEHQASGVLTRAMISARKSKRLRRITRKKQEALSTEKLLNGKRKNIPKDITPQILQPYLTFPTVEASIAALFQSKLQNHRKTKYALDGNVVDKKFFDEIIRPTQHVNNSHLDLILSAYWRKWGNILRKKRIFIADSLFLTVLSSKSGVFSETKRKESFPWPPFLRNYIKGSAPGRDLLQPWFLDALIIYAPMNWGNKHWVALKIDLSAWHISIYDPMISLTAEKKLPGLMAPAAHMLPYLITDSCPKEVTTQARTTPFTFSRIPGIAQNTRSGDCGPFAIKLIEMLSQDMAVEQMQRITNHMVDQFRLRYALDVYEAFVRKID